MAGGLCVSKSFRVTTCILTVVDIAVAGASATIAADALMNPFDGMQLYFGDKSHIDASPLQL